MKAILFIGTAQELRQRLALCKLQGRDLVTYAYIHGTRYKVPTWTQDDDPFAQSDNLRNFASSCSFAGSRGVKQ